MICYNNIIRNYKINKMNKETKNIMIPQNILFSNKLLSLNNCFLTHSYSPTSTLDSKSIKSSPENLDYSFNKNISNCNKKILNTSINEGPNFSFKSSNNLINKNNSKLQEEKKIYIEKSKEAIKEINSQLTKMNYCNIIQSNSMQRLNLSLSFLSSEIKKLKLLNKKRKLKLQIYLENLKNNKNKSNIN